MANRNWTSNPDRKITSSGGVKDMGAGGSPSMPRKQSFTSMGLPGPMSHGFTAAKKGYREVNGYAAYKGLSQSTADDYNRDARTYEKARSRMKEYDLQEGAGHNVVDNAKRNKTGDYRLSGTKTPYEVDPHKLGKSDIPYGILYERKRTKK